MIVNVLSVITLIVFYCISGIVLGKTYAIEAVFLADKSKDGVNQICTFAHASVECITNHAQGVSRIWKLYPPYLAYEIKDKGKSTIYFLNLRTGIVAKKASISVFGDMKSLWVSPSGARTLSIEKAPFGNLLVSKGIYLDNSYKIIQKVSPNVSIVGWIFPADIAYLKVPNVRSVIALSLDNGKRKEVIHFSDKNKSIMDVSFSSGSTSFAFSWKKDNRYSLEMVVEGVRKVVANSSSLYSPYISDDGNKVIYIEKKSDKKNVINMFNNNTNVTTKYFIVDYEINNLILLSGYKKTGLKKGGRLDLIEP